MSSRVALFVFAFLASILVAFASPVPGLDGEPADIERRVLHTGRGTWYNPGLGNCGWVNSDGDAIVAIGKGLYDQNNGGNCGQYVTITNTANGNTVSAIAADSCQSCTMNDLDMSPSIFKQLASLDEGKIAITWHFQNKAWKPSN